MATKCQIDQRVVLPLSCQMRALAQPPPKHLTCGKQVLRIQQFSSSKTTVEPDVTNLLGMVAAGGCLLTQGELRFYVHACIPSEMRLKCSQALTGRLCDQHPGVLRSHLLPFGCLMMSTKSPVSWIAVRRGGNLLPTRAD